MAEKDITGMRHGMCVAVRREGSVPVGNQGVMRPTWLIRCDCGVEKVVSKPDFVAGDHKSCGCNSVAASRKTKIRDLTGQRFGRLVALEQVQIRDSAGTSRSAWICLCDCGESGPVYAGSLTTGVTKSCGCYRREHCATVGSDGAEATARWAAQRAERGTENLTAHQIRTSRMRDAFVEEVDRQLVFERDNGLCQICYTPIGDALWEVDHIVSLARGGEHSYLNVQLAHRTCNRQKWAS